MYGFKRDLEIHNLIGAEIIQIRLGLCDVQFNFDSGHVFSAEGLVEVLQKETLIAYWNAEIGWSDRSCLSLLNSGVKEYKVLSNRLLELRLKEDLFLHFHDDSEHYECLHIHPEGIIA